ncbi:MAG: hypothetical protein EOO73_12255 [Myxococcales bacterium]|nr:MAG: hypothetical protein EOO73_12255 [Myxococcales bacterium]
MGGGAGMGGTGGGSSCAAGWQGNVMCDTCTGQTQSDLKACVAVLDCYVLNSCGPASCSQNDDKCGANKLQKGTAAYPIAKQVYDCMCK